MDSSKLCYVEIMLALIILIVPWLLKEKKTYVIDQAPNITN